MFARTERLLLRPGWPEDAATLTKAIGSEAIVLNLAHVPWPHDLSDAGSYLGRDRAPGEVDLLIFMRTRDAPRLIGGIGLAHQDGRTMLGYWIVPSCWGLGFATEAGRAVVDIARDTLRLDRLTACHFSDNPASGNVLAKLGFERNGPEQPLFSAARGHEAAAQRYALQLGAMAMAA